MTELRKKVEDNCSKALEVLAAAYYLLSAQRRSPEYAGYAHYGRQRKAAD